MGILDDWTEDMPQQFQGKERIEDLISAFAKQIEELHRVFKQLDTETDLESAVGQNLDYLGNVVNLTRKDAHVILRKAKEMEITDEVYRQVLKYGIIKNNCNCTYYDIMNSMHILWNTNDIQYVEKPERPATIYIRIKNVGIDEPDPVLKRILAIKPSGVGMIYDIRYFFVVNISGIEKADFYRLVVHMDGRSGFKNRSSADFYRIILLYRNKLKEVSRVSAILLETMANTAGIEKADFNGLMIHMDGRSGFCNSGRAYFYKILLLYRNKIKESVSAEVIIKKNLWYLDGTYNLDGYKLINAKIDEEVL